MSNLSNVYARTKNGILALTRTVVIHMDFQVDDQHIGNQDSHHAHVLASHLGLLFHSDITPACMHARMHAARILVCMHATRAVKPLLTERC